MSWLDKIQNDLIIITGDGKQYKPSWVMTGIEKEFNVTQFNYPDIKGTKVDRRKNKGRVYSLSIFFQGEDHLDQSAAFDISSDDERPWTIQHPLYDTLTVQPLSFKVDHSDANVSKIICPVMETIVEDNPRSSFEPVDQLKLMKENMDIQLESALTKTPAAADGVVLQDVNEKNFKKGIAIITLPAEFEEYSNLFNAADSALTTITASPILAMRAITAALTYPYKFTENVKSRLDVLVNEFNNLRDTLAGILNTNNVAGKQLYQNNQATVIASMCLAAATPLPGNYTNSTGVLSVMDTIIESHDAFLEDLDEIQTINGGKVTSYIPDAQVLITLTDIVNLTLSSLFDIALNSKMERTLYLEEDTNIVVLTHRLYGMDPFDNNMNELIENNNIGRLELLCLKKGRKIVYYI